MEASQLRSLLNKYIDLSISEREFSDLWEVLNDSSREEETQQVIGDVLTERKQEGLSRSDDRTQRLRQISALIANDSSTDTSKSSVSYLTTFLKYAAAVLLILSCTYLFTAEKRKSAALAIVKPTSTIENIQPGSQKALLTLGDGRVIVLDAMANGLVAQQGGSKVIKLANGQIHYNLSGAINDQQEPVFNTMTTPIGGQYELTLPDGTKVWLNAASSITYPSVFIGNERNVKITGEVYFEVAKDKTKPFHVSAGDQQIEVLGTHFNVNAYADEGQIKTSLLEGSVKVNKQLLAPGQAFMNGKISSTDVDQDVAWKNGVFNFNDQTLSQVMRQLSRWYNLEVVYPSGVPKKEYGGEMGRNLSLDQILKGLENSGVQFQLEGRRLTVKL